jgi:DNA-binding GntR family transcriptional regulator
MAYLLITQAARAAEELEQTRLRLTYPQVSVFTVTRIRLDGDDRPLAHEKVVLPLDRFPGLVPNDEDIPDIAQLAQRHGLTLGRATESVGIVAASEKVALHLRIAAGTDVLKLDRVIETADGVPLEWRVAFILTATLRGRALREKVSSSAQNASAAIKGWDVSADSALPHAKSVALPLE